MEIIRFKGQFVKKSHFKTDIGLSGDLPCYIFICVPLYKDSVSNIVTQCPESSCSGATIHVYLRQIKEAVLITTDSIITHQTISTPKFKICHGRNIPEIFI
ncbi:hypothetical protein SDC9_171129 [bioreactor metagenome]|uniref:Uncharacterized protein n=1 Tax=bioreactor metagenome TaxID=1076179 RepID=A0A645GC89_9ZZZZ